MQNSLYIKSLSDGTEKNFSVDGSEIRVDKYTYTAGRMGAAPTLTASIMFTRPLDNEWSGLEYVIFRGERYYIYTTPSSSKDNQTTLYKHDITFVSERTVLDNEYFYDVVNFEGDAYEDGYHSNNAEFSFWGKISDFVERLNRAIKYVGYDYRVRFASSKENPLPTDDTLLSEEREVSFSNKKLSEAIQEINTTFKLPYYFKGKDIIIGYTENVLTHVFEYGKDGGLLSVSKQNSNNAIVTRITGRGSSDNIPYYYPNVEPHTDSSQPFIPYSPNLMPPIYRESMGKERYCNAENNKYVNPTTGEYYEFVNEYDSNNPHAAIQPFEDVRPSIVGMLNARDIPMDRILDVAFDDNDNDELLETEMNYAHPYFYVKLARLDGEHGFNLFDQALESDTAKIAFTSGECASCEFEIGVEKKQIQDKGETKYQFLNPVQVYPNGDLYPGDFSAKVKPWNIQQEQQDTRVREVWIALKKNNSTRTILMPNVAHNIKPKADDKFVITGIKMPESYIRAAEERLEQELVKYMAENNMEKFNFTIKFSRIYLANNPDVAMLLNENARLYVRYNGQNILLYVTNYSVKADGNILEEVTVQLADSVEVKQSALATKLSEAKSDILNSVAGSDTLARMTKYFLRKDNNDSTPFDLTAKSFKTHGFTQGNPVGSGAAIYTQDGKSYIETDYLSVRLKAFFAELAINKVSYTYGDVIIGHAGNTITKAFKARKTYPDISGIAQWVEDEEHATGYYCEINNKDNTSLLDNYWEIDDLARCQVYDDINYKFYWRKVIDLGVDYVVLSIDDCAEGSDIPAEGDEIVQMGNATDTDRQDGIMLSVMDTNAPCIKMYTGLDTYVFDEANIPIIISPHGSKFTGELFSTAGGKVTDLSEAFTLIEQKIDQLTLAVGEQANGANNQLIDSAFNEDFKYTVDNIERRTSSTGVRKQNYQNYLYDGMIPCYILKSTATIPRYLKWLNIILEPDTDYTLSFMARDNALNNITTASPNMVVVQYNGGETVDIATLALTSENFDNTWKKYQICFRTKPSSITGNERYSVWFKTGTMGAMLLVKPMLAKGGERPWTESNADTWSTKLVLNATSASLAVLADGVEQAGVHIDGQSSEIRAVANHFKVQNKEGLTTMEVDSDGNLKGNGDAAFLGKVVSGDADGQRVELNPVDKKVTVYNSNSELITQIEGNRRTKDTAIPSDSVGNFIGINEGKEVEIHNVQTQKGTEVICYKTTLNPSVTPMRFYFDRDSGIGYTLNTEATANLYLRAYNSNAFTTMTEEVFVGTVTNGMDSKLYMILAPSGYLRLELDYSYVGKELSSMVSIYVCVSSIENIDNNYALNIFANGLCARVNKNNYFMPIAEDQIMNLYMKSAGVEYKIENGVFSREGQPIGGPTLMYRGLVDNTGNTAYSVTKYSGTAGMNVTAAATGTRTLTFTNLGYSMTMANTIVHLTCYNKNPIQIGFKDMTANSLVVTMYRYTSTMYIPFIIEIWKDENASAASEESLYDAPMIEEPSIDV